MPELPEVETVRRGLAPHFEGSIITRIEQNRPDLRFPFPDKFVERLTGVRMTSLGRRAKYLMGDMESGDVLVMHLGMSGSFRIDVSENGAPLADTYYPASKLPQHDHVVFHLNNEQSGAHARVVYNDPRRFGFMDLIERRGLHEHKLFAQMGIEPLGNQLDGAYLGHIFEGKKTSFKAALLNQKFIAGLGNIYVCEALWRAGLNPSAAAGSISGRGAKKKEKRDLLATCIRDVLAEAIEAGGSTLKDHVQTDGSLGYFQHSFAVYDQEGQPCRKPDCSGTIERVVQNGRSTFFCGSCQR
ncbi:MULTISPECIES: bifunctional DNA-formamidopyrimidine glycosylase/DNA-(apurinic or apyrimidinic site) lyase [Pseudovibrio]|uniref:bifunctional DNA-formamidopyrimidine glycosylase/DNA-(apurinic or apyrimidinic site) lyase n=1 Tax=Stappiaceae TaxID=2821832 RepID=UPI002365928F|nr:MULTISPECIES: bifunctional DNA-formamidopyrimidine glycosylase/DNA-(apurinic or apyrimidinic site) lyase [Pseudovibrio]MDD7909656.1 bifunctional DNA-formamidopyrimidine glycosylase/DNA-(apurinic or apyrimidinic site) lyase [Pseudovibrio exalbescens]MDX5591998.1 bifunctional DNA-formamidopyrimidine glycosylase/DNA-(apurinic or apyrimidinic site) lyase [Pseudovibrio sp. SPO723]